MIDSNGYVITRDNGKTLIYAGTPNNRGMNYGGAFESDPLDINLSDYTKIGEGALACLIDGNLTGSLSGVTSIGKKAFYSCMQLTEAQLSSSITEIPDSAFYKCYRLNSINIPASVTRIGVHAFAHCPLEEATLSGSNLTTIDNYAFYNNSPLKSINIPASVKTLGEYAFSGCSQLANLTGCQGLTKIGINCFERIGVKTLDLSITTLT